MLKEVPDYQSYEYLERFSKVLDKGEVSQSIAIEASIQAAVNKKDGYLLMAAPSAVLGPDTKRFLGHIVSRAAYWGSIGKERERIDLAVIKRGLQAPEKPELAFLADLLGQLLGKVIRGESEGTHYIWSRIRQSSESSCKKLSESEFGQLSEFILSAAPAILNAEAIPWRDVKSLTNLCGINLYRDL